MVITGSTQAVQSYDRSKQLMSTVIRSTSCNRGWLRVVVQGIFGIIIVSSFILIVRMSVYTSNDKQMRLRGRCVAGSCRVVCHAAPLNGNFENHIIEAVKNTKCSCGRVFVTLNRPMFINARLPPQWLSEIRINVSELEIVGGNLQYISPESFVSQFGSNLRVLVLSKITINTLAADTFLELSNLRGLYLVDCNIINIRQNSLQAIDDTLKILKIRFDNFWDPANVTGSTAFEQLRVVDLSNNEFDGILGRDSFSGLKKCRVLYLSWCKISFIGAGAFDSLQSIEILHLNNNYLVTLPSDLLKNIVPLKPRISLQENSWHCDCLNHNLRMLSELKLLIIDPICEYPPSYRGVTFSEFERHCYNNNSLTEIIPEDLYIFSEKVETVIHEQSNTSLTYSNNYNNMNVYFPLPEHKCSMKKIEGLESNLYIDGLKANNNWLNPTFSIQTNKLSMLALTFLEPNNYGLVWYKSSNKKEMYCISPLPKTLLVFDVDLSLQYTFCRVDFTSESTTKDKCVIYDLSSLQASPSYVIFYKSILILVCIAIICLLSGALCVYALIHRNPILLKGNKRVVFVKHKTVDALILPPKVPLRYDLPDHSKTAYGKKSNIFVIPGNHKKALTDNFLRTNSVRTTESNDPSYISALQPTEDELAEWRITRQLQIKCTYDSLDSNFSAFSRNYSNDSLPYYSLDNNEKFYDPIKM